LNSRNFETTTKSEFPLSASRVASFVWPLSGFSLALAVTNPNY